MGIFVFWLLTNVVVPQEDVRFTHVFKQGFDTSCGISATATLLNKYWNIPILQSETYQEMIINRIDANADNYTISFATINDYLSSHNIQSRAYRMDWDELRDALEKGFEPIIIHYQTPTAHFALLLHIERDFAFVADPSRGFELVDRWTFTKHFSGNVMLTASRVHQKNNKYIAQIISEKQNKLNRLQRVARLR